MEHHVALKVTLKSVFVNNKKENNALLTILKPTLKELISQFRMGRVRDYSH